MPLPSDVDPDTNGALDPSLLAPCGVFSTFAPFGELRMHHAAAIAMRAMVAAMCADLHIDHVSATETYRTLRTQETMFDGTDPARRTKHAGRYIPDHLWSTFPAGALDANDQRPKGNRKYLGHKWRRRFGTAEAAVPGTSNHGLGLAVDLAMRRGFFEWLTRNAGDFGFDQENPSEDWHWRYHAGDKLPRAVTGTERRRRRLPPPDTRPPDNEIQEDDDMKVIDINPDTPEFTRMVIDNRVKWVRGLAASSLERMKVPRFDVERQELIALLHTFGTDGPSPFGGGLSNAAPDEQLDNEWEAARR